ncbi:U-box domain-containing protein 14 [Glycine soja]|uniref:U-box domain-containing protein 14 n=1 Tax=Glycine soja TaxID=3848 RepID=A0A445JKE0_GLYSO|nr:U-box domain-containing protein 14 [Glycine soja]
MCVCLFLNGIELPKRQGNCRTKKCGGSSLSEDAATALIKLLCEGTPTGKKDAATAIFNLSIYQGNKPRAVKAGIIALLIQFLKDAGGGIVDEVVAIMEILASHHEGRVAIGQAKSIHILVEVIRTGSPRNRENAAAVLWPLCTEDPLQLKLAKEHGAEAALQELSENGTDRAKIKAGSILELLQRMEGLKIPLKPTTFAWRLIKDTIPTKGNLRRRQFLWGGGMEQRKIAWVGWKEVCQPKDKGGLGIKDLKTFNSALLAKWCWDLFHKQEEPWAKILISKYGGWRALEEGIRGSQDSIWWRELLSSQQQQQNEVVKTERNWKVGGGEKFRFWEDPWTHNAIPLMDKYPRLYRISDQQKQIIMNMGNNTNDGWEWKLSWRMALFDSEIQMADNFLGELSQQ